MTINLSITTSAIADGNGIDAADVLTPLGEIEVHLENTLNGAQDAEAIRFVEGSAPSTPASGKWKIYFKSTGLYAIEDTGTEHGPLQSQAPASAQYIVATVNSSLSAEQSIGALTTGMMYNTVSASVGTISTATRNTHYSLIQNALLRDEKATTTDGGSASAATWNARNLNTEVYDPNSIVSISSNKFTPTSGTYKITASAPALKVGVNRLRLYNVTGAASVDEGQNTSSAAADAVTSRAYLNTFFTANGTDEYRIDHYTASAQATNGLGAAVGDGTNEVYLEILLEKLA